MYSQWRRQLNWFFPTLTALLLIVKVLLSYQLL